MLRINAHRCAYLRQCRSTVYYVRDFYLFTRVVLFYAFTVALTHFNQSSPKITDDTDWRPEIGAPYGVSRPAPTRVCAHFSSRRLVIRMSGRGCILCKQTYKQRQNMHSCVTLRDAWQCVNRLILVSDWTGCRPQYTSVIKIRQIDPAVVCMGFILKYLTNIIPY